MTAPPAELSTRPAQPADTPWWAVDPQQVAARLGTDPELGLSVEEATRRLTAVGPNQLQAAKRRPRWPLFLAQFTNTMIMVLLAAAVVTAILGDLKDTVVIVAVVVLNAIISFVQELRAEEAITALQRMSAPQAHITRAGQPQTIPADQLVPGDLLHLEAGEILPADARLLEAPNLRVNEAALTGESVPVDKHPAALAGQQLVVADQHNMVFKGTAVSYGRGRAIVTATGMGTALGQIAELLATRRPPPTPLQRRLATLGRVLALAVVVISAVVFAVGVAAGEPASRMLLAAVSLAVAAIPESLPAVVTLSLALGAHRMARQQAIIRKLPAVETLGSVTGDRHRQDRNLDPGPHAGRAGLDARRGGPGQRLRLCPRRRVHHRQRRRGSVRAAAWAAAAGSRVDQRRPPAATRGGRGGLGGGRGPDRGGPVGPGRQGGPGPRPAH
jgi:P-type Ca2+ transporter type 2C